VSRIRAVAAASVALMAVVLVPAIAVAQEDPSPANDWGATTDPWSGGQSADARLTVTDVSVTRYDGFDRVVFRTEGDGEAGWAAEYGPPVRVTGAVALRSPSPVSLPRARVTTGAVHLRGRGRRPCGSVVLEVISDVVADGQHTFFIGLDETLPYRVVRIVEPKAIAIDFIRGPAGEEDRGETEVLADARPMGTPADEGSTTDADAVPVGGWRPAGAGSPPVHRSPPAWARRPPPAAARDEPAVPAAEHRVTGDHHDR
jgi:hypothetical protein